MTDATRIDPHLAFEIAALRLHLVVGMAAADDRVCEDELGDLVALVDSAPVSAQQRRHLRQLLDALLVDPPQLEELLRQLVERVDDPAVAQLLVDDLKVVARSDGRVDPREEGMLRLVCGALGLDPISLYDEHERAAGDASAADLARLVRALLDLDAEA